VQPSKVSIMQSSVQKAMLSGGYFRSDGASLTETQGGGTEDNLGKLVSEKILIICWFSNVVPALRSCVN